MKTDIVRIEASPLVPLRTGRMRRVRESRRTETGNASDAGLRQIEEFTTKLHRIRRRGYGFSIVLILLSLICVGLSALGLDVAAVYSAAAFALLLHMTIAGVAHFREERRTSRAYWNYLDGYSRQQLLRLAGVVHLSAWSRHEIDRYLAAPHLTW